MKLGIFIPAHNEKKTIGKVLEGIPSTVRGFIKMKVFVIDDGSTDETAEVALNTAKKLWGGEKKKNLSDQILQMARSGYAKKEVLGGGGVEFELVAVPKQHGLANAFKIGLAACLKWGADAIVHFDADGQYVPAEMEKLVQPFLKGEADIVTGDRQIEKLQFLGAARKYGNLIGSFFVRLIGGIKVRDVSCGFRAVSRSAAMRLEVHSSHTYTHETLLQTRSKALRLAQVPITFLPRPDRSKSRLTSRLLRHITRSLADIVRAWWRYRR